MDWSRKDFWVRIGHSLSLFYGEIRLGWTRVIFSLTMYICVMTGFTSVIRSLLFLEGQQQRVGMVVVVLHCLDMSWVDS